MLLSDNTAENARQFAMRCPACSIRQTFGYCQGRWNSPQRLRGCRLTHYHTIFGAYRSWHCWHIQIFSTFLTAMPNFIKIGWTVAEIRQFNSFQNGGRLHLGFLKFELFNGQGIWDIHFPSLYCTKFRKDRSNCCWDIAIFVIFKMAASVILDFQKFKTFAVGSL